MEKDKKEYEQKQKVILKKLKIKTTYVTWYFIKKNLKVIKIYISKFLK